MSESANTPVRVRFCPSPTGTPHVGLIRTALFNWAHARHHGGAFVFRIEDTDASRDSVESYEALLDALRWLGLTWDEGPEVGGPHAPYRQSERGPLYADALRRLIEAGEVYESFSNADGDRGPAPGGRPRPEARLRQRRPRAHRRAAGRLPGRRAGAGLPAADARSGHHLPRLRARRGHLPGRQRARLRAGPRRRLTALPADEPARRRADGDHRRAARGGPALLHPAADRPARGAGPGRSGQRAAALRPPAAGHRRGKPQAVEAGSAVESVPVPRARLHSGGSAQLSGPARLVHRRGPGHFHAWPKWRPRSTSPGCPAMPARFDTQEGRGHQRRTSAGAAGRTTSHAGSSPTSPPSV